MALNTLTAVFARLTVVTNTQTSPLHLQKWATSLLCMRESVEEKSVWTNCEYWSSRSWCWGSVCFTSAFSTLWTCHKVQRISAIKQLKYTTCQICHIVWGMYAGWSSTFLRPGARGWINHWSVMHGQCDARPTVTFPAAGHHCTLTSTKLYCLVTEARVCE